jgi:DNA-binding NarL/FixJ family response regulator
LCELCEGVEIRLANRYGTVFGSYWNNNPALWFVAKPWTASMRLKKQRETYPDLVLLDLAMPRLNGVEAARTLKCILPKAPIVLFTVYADAFRKLAPVLHMDIDVVFSKSDGLAKLVHCMQELFNSGQN